MAHYLIFIPNGRGSSPDQLVKVGLGELLREGDPSPEIKPIDRGPDGRSGNLITWRTGDRTRDPVFKIHDFQRWEPAVALTHPELGELEAKRYWVGVDTERPIEPRDLLRPNPIAAGKITLADGNSWAVPSISRLPNQYKIQDGGEIARVVKEQYERFYKTGMGVVAQLMEQFSQIEEMRDQGHNLDDYYIDVTAKDGVMLVAEAISLNYRVNWELAFLLGLLDEDTAAWALMAFCELNEIKRTIDQKKSLPPVLISVGSYSQSGVTG